MDETNPYLSSRHCYDGSPCEGRYGDSINPWGDILAIAEAHCASTAEAKLVIGVPTVHQRHGSVVFNANRIYGEHNFPYLGKSWVVNSMLLTFFIFSAKLEILLAAQV